MKVTCPNCRQVIPADDIALDKGWAKCVRCNEVFQLAQLVPEYEAAAAPAAKPPERPFDAWVVTERDGDRLIIHVPPMGMRAGTWAMLGFATFWTGFIAFWTAGASGLLFGAKPGAVNIGFAAFSIPFWLIGFGMLGGVLWTARGSRVVLLDASKMVTELRCLFWRRRKLIDRAAVQCAREGVVTVKSDQPSSTYFPYPAEIIYEKGSFKLPCNSETERAWLLAEINGFLQQVPYRPSAFDARDEFPPLPRDLRADPSLRS
jgi:predicted Zn finger-like uncharacterized protein